MKVGSDFKPGDIMRIIDGRWVAFPTNDSDLNWQSFHGDVRCLVLGPSDLHGYDGGYHYVIVDGNKGITYHANLEPIDEAR